MELIQTTAPQFAQSRSNYMFFVVLLLLVSGIFAVAYFAQNAKRTPRQSAPDTDTTTRTETKTPETMPIQNI